RNCRRIRPRRATEYLESRQPETPNPKPDTMNFLQIILKQMRQRSLSTWLTMMSVLLGVALAVAIMVLRREGANLFAQSDFGYDILIGPPKGSPLQLTLNTIYHMDVSPGVIPYELYEDMARKTAPP